MTRVYFQQTFLAFCSFSLSTVLDLGKYNKIHDTLWMNLLLSDLISVTYCVNAQLLE